MKNNKFNRNFRRGVAATLGALCCSSIISEAKIDLDLENIMDVFELSETDSNKFSVKLKEITDKLLNLGTIEIDPSFEQVNDKSKFVIISALEKLSEIPLVKNALTRNGKKCKLIGGKSLSEFDISSCNPYVNKLWFAYDFYERNSDYFYIKATNLNSHEHLQYINEGKVFGDDKKDSHVWTRMLLGMSLTEKNQRFLSCLNSVLHEVGHLVAEYSAATLMYSSNACEKFKRLMFVIGKKPKYSNRDGGTDWNDDLKMEKNIENLKRRYKYGGPEYCELLPWLGGADSFVGDPPYISNRGTNTYHEYLAELFVHLCGFNIPISNHAERYAKILKVIHGDDCLGPTVKY